MSYALRNDGLGWRSVNSPDDCTEDETYSATEPSPIDLVSVQTQFTPLDFLDKFTDAEQLAVVAATRESDPIKLWYDKMLASTFVDLNDPRTSAGLSALVSEGLLSQSRYDEIMGVAE